MRELASRQEIGEWGKKKEQEGKRKRIEKERGGWKEKEEEGGFDGKRKKSMSEGMKGMCLEKKDELLSSDPKFTRA